MFEKLREFFLGKKKQKNEEKLEKKVFSRYSPNDIWYNRLEALEILAKVNEVDENLLSKLENISEKDDDWRIRELAVSMLESYKDKNDFSDTEPYKEKLAEEEMLTINLKIKNIGYDKRDIWYNRLEALKILDKNLNFLEEPDQNILADLEEIAKKDADYRIQGLAWSIIDKFNKDKTSKTPFGEYWGLIGNQEKSCVEAIVGAITKDSDFNIGLTAMQLDNIGYGYGSCYVQLFDDIEPTPVDVYNAFGARSFDRTKIYVSRGLAEKMELKEGDKLTILRKIDEEGKIKYQCKNAHTHNRFGKTWDELCSPVQAIIAAIDDKGYNCELYRVGLSAMQMKNLDVERLSNPLNAKDLKEVIEKNEKGLLDAQDFGKLMVSKGDKEVSVQIYNAFGMNAIGGCGVRVSSTLAEELDLKLGDQVILYIK